MYHKFSYLNSNILKFLFQTYCMSFYGCELWFNLHGSKNKFGNLTKSYHRAIKKILGFFTWDSNHKACEKAGLPIFVHLVNKRIINFLFSLLNSEALVYFI